MTLRVRVERLVCANKMVVHQRQEGRRCRKRRYGFTFKFEIPYGPYTRKQVSKTWARNFLLLQRTQDSGKAWKLRSACGTCGSFRRKFRTARWNFVPIVETWSSFTIQKPVVIAILETCTRFRFKIPAILWNYCQKQPLFSYFKFFTKNYCETWLWIFWYFQVSHFLSENTQKSR